MSRQVRAFRALIRLYPMTFRVRYGDQMVGLFVDELREAHGDRTTLAIVRLWARVLGDIIATAPSQHLRKESPVLQPVDPVPFQAPPVRPRIQRIAVAVAAVPPVLWAVLWLVAPGFMEPILATPPAILGLPAGLVVSAFAGGMAAFGWVVARHARSRAIAVGALVFLTTPALVLIVMTPALVLWASNMP